MPKSALGIATRTLSQDIARCFNVATAILVFLLTASPQARTQEPTQPKPMIGWVPREILERPVSLRAGIGTIHDKITTSSSQAQAFYDQGLAYLNSYVWIEAARSFNQALRLDPSLAMAYLGLSDAYIGLQDLREAAAAFEKARTLSEKVSVRERAWIAIRGRYFEFLADSGNMQKYFAYRQEIASALTADPGDPLLWVLRGFADEGTPIAHGQNGGIDTVAFYQAAVTLAPDSFVGHHYLAHTFENTGPVEQAMVQSSIYAKLAPSIPHAHHMYGHELRHMGHVEEAIAEFRKADDLENSYYQSENIPAEYDWHHAHNLQLLAMCYQALGEMKAAEAAYRQAFALPSHADLSDYNRKAWPEFLLDRGRPQEALEASQSLIRSQWSLAQFAGHAVAGRALLALGRSDDAKTELTLADQQIQAAPAGAADRFPDASLLRAELLLREKNWTEGNALMQQVEQKLQALPGPDAWSATIFQLERIAKIGRQLGDWELAESTAQKMIEHDPSYSGGYYALGLALDHNGDPAARQQFAIANKLWNKADPGLQR
jgi:tetratricopeptide (TPR) repeat protein